MCTIFFITEKYFRQRTELYVCNTGTYYLYITIKQTVQPPPSLRSQTLVLGRWWKHREPLSPPAPQHPSWENLFDLIILVLWSLMKSCNFQGKAWVTVVTTQHDAPDPAQAAAGMFLEQLAHSLQELRGMRRALSPKLWRSVPLL